jgi:hypothetical protein
MSNPSEWPDQLDALQAARYHHTLLFENDMVRVLDTRVMRGQTVPLHAHRWPSVLYILSWSDFVRRDCEGRTILDSRLGQRPPLGSAVWSSPLPPHTLENVGEAELRAISVELKNAGPLESKIRR